MADQRFQEFLDQNRQSGTGPVDVRSGIAKMREKKATTGALPWMTNAVNGVNRGMTQMIETPYNLVNRAPQIANLLPGEQGVGTLDEMGVPGFKQMGKDPLIDFMGKNYPGMDQVGGIDQPNPEYPITNRVTEDIGVGVGTMGLGLPFTSAKTGLAGLMGKYLGTPLKTAPIATVAAETASAGGAATGRYVADENDIKNPVGRFLLEMGGSMAPMGVIDAGNAFLKHQVYDEAGSATIDAMDRLRSKYGEKTGAKMRPSIGLTGNETASTLENAGAIIPGFGSVAKNVQKGQINDFGTIVKSAAGDVRPTGAASKADDIMLGEQVHDITKEGLGRMKAGFSQREDALEQSIGIDSPVDITNTRKAIADMIPHAAPEQQKALQYELEQLDQMVIKNKTVAQQPVTKTSSVLGADGQPITTQGTQAVESVTPTNTVPYKQFRNWRSDVGRRTDMPSIPGGQMKKVYDGITSDLESVADKSGVGDDFRTLMSDQAKAHDDTIRMSEGGDIPAMEKLSSNQLEQSKEFFNKSIGNPDRVELLKRNATPEQWQQFVGDTLEYLGVANNSAQGAAGDLISPNTFLTNWNKMDPRTKNIMFDDDLGTRQTLDDLAIVAEAMRQRGNSSNFSNTAGVGMNAGAIGAIGGFAGGAGLQTAAAALPGALVGAGITYATLKGLMSQTMARWAANQGIPLGDKMITQGMTGAAKAGQTTEEQKQRKFAPRPVPVDDPGDHEYR